MSNAASEQLDRVLHRLLSHESPQGLDQVVMMITLVQIDQLQLALLGALETVTSLDLLVEGEDVNEHLSLSWMAMIS